MTQVPREAQLKEVSGAVICLHYDITLFVCYILSFCCHTSLKKPMKDLLKLARILNNAYEICYIYYQIIWDVFLKIC